MLLVSLTLFTQTLIYFLFIGELHKNVSYFIFFSQTFYNFSQEMFVNLPLFQSFLK